MTKTYKELELFAKNSPRGSFAAGCPVGVLRDNSSEGVTVDVLDHGTVTTHFVRHQNGWFPSNIVSRLCEGIY